MGNLNSLVYHGYEYDENYKQGISMQWHLTVACDQRCKHCYMFTDDGYISQKDGQLKTDQAYKLIDDFATLLRKLRTVGFINLTGGDPILSHNFWDILRYVPKHSDVLSLNAIMGNSFHIDNSVAEKLRSHGITTYQISLDGLEETHDNIRKPGSFKDTLRAMKCLHENGIQTAVMATVHKRNCGEIIDLYKYLDELDYVDSFAFDRMIPIGNGKKELSADIVDIAEYKEMMHILFVFDMLVSKRKILVYKDTLWLPLFYEMGLTNPVDKNAKTYCGTCPAGGGGLCVLSDGTVYACRRLDLKAGKYPEESIEKIFLSSPLFSSLRNLVEDTVCGDCHLQYYCNGCPAMKYAITGKLGGRDPSCWH